MFICVRLAAIGAAVGVNEDAVGVDQDAVGVIWNVAKDSQSGFHLSAAHTVHCFCDFHATLFADCCTVLHRVCCCRCASLGTAT